MSDYVAKPIRVEELTASLLRCATEEAVPRSVAASETPPSDPPPPTSSAVDPTLLEGLATTLGDNGADLVDEILEIYLDETPHLMDGLRNAVAQEAFDDVVRAAHALKSSSVNVGATLLGALTADLETHAKTGDVEAMTALMADAEEAYLQTRHELAAYMATPIAQT